MKLTIELVPSSCWYANVRNNVAAPIWNAIRKKVYAMAGHKCEICGTANVKLECHEIWDYNDVTFIQKLVKMIALCNNCHTVKHIRLARIKGWEERALKHLAKINNITLEDAKLYVEAQFEIWSKRSTHDWTLNIVALDNYIDKGEE